MIRRARLIVLPTSSISVAALLALAPSAFATTRRASSLPSMSASPLVARNLLVWLSMTQPNLPIHLLVTST